jgi:DNA-binding response OmpR family regulator
MDSSLIAVVDDDVVLGELLRELLTDEGYRALIVEEATSAAERLSTERPDLILLDLRLGERGVGWHVLEALRRDGRTASVPIIVCTADQGSLRERAGELSAFNCAAIEKPFDLDELLCLIRTQLSQPPAADVALLN